jgi:hypothetical protein
MKWAGYVESIGERRGVYNVLVGKYEGKRALETPRHRRYNDFIAVWDGLAWSYLVQNGGKTWAVFRVVMKLWVQ